MKLEKLLAISGMSGIYTLISNKNDGLIVEDLDGGKRQFVPARGHQFTPLATVFVFVDNIVDDTVPLKNVFKTMLENFEIMPPVTTNASANDIKAYFAKILPNYDRERVYVGDMKKIIKWFNFLKERNFLTLDEPQEGTNTAEEITTAQNNLTSEPE